MKIFRDESGLWVAVINGRVSGGHSTPDAAKIAIIKAEIERLSTIGPADNYIPPNVATGQDYALDYLNIWRGDRRIAAGLTESMYYEAQRWRADPDTPFGLDGQRGRMSREQYAGWIIKTWTKIEADYSLAVSLVKQAKTVDEIAIILARRG